MQLLFRNFDLPQGEFGRNAPSFVAQLFLIAAALALLVGVTGAYAWDQQATDDRMSYQATHGQSLPTANYPNKSSGRY